MLNQKISEDLKEAMKAGKEFETGVLRMILSSLHNKEIEKKGKGGEEALSDEEVIEVLSKEVKKRKEAAEMFNNAGRGELGEKELKELEFLKKYLPEQVGVEEIEKIVKAAVEKTGAKTVKEFGKVMAEAMKDLKGKADASAVSEAAKKFLTNE
ncbi:MAG: GatB/YqeY domain-containing protein [Candidatus Paceibacterota bacterium]